MSGTCLGHFQLRSQDNSGSKPLFLIWVGGNEASPEVDDIGIQDLRVCIEGLDGIIKGEDQVTKEGWFACWGCIVREEVSD